MGVFTFVLRKSGGEWTAKQHSGDIEESSPSTFEIQRKLVKAALATDSSGAVQSSFSTVSPSSAVFQVVVGGAVFVGGGVAAAAAPAGGAASAGEAAPVAEKKEEKVEEEEEDDDLGLSLFD
ncbi:large ribosomal subunit protein P3-like [Gastrolobium bilobum]|uniref:large ribosomal subunit protein P3-like n=1 Tax=Gastrolobium bilobum TaxID=150636 RepID=UPI002AB01F26|nr:large ribosomal subunit protein P3-like [Gastrolobium bilobum]